MSEPYLERAAEQPSADSARQPDAEGAAPVATATYLLVDGENIDATIGNSVLGRRPEPDERPRWERVLDFAKRNFGQPVKPLFFLNASNSLPMAFVQALLAIGYRPIPLAGRYDQKVVDLGIQRTMEALADRPGHVLLASHDGDFLAQTRALLVPGRRVGLLGLKEFVNLGFTDLMGAGLEMFDLETDVQCFRQALPRTRIIPIEEYDPTAYL